MKKVFISALILVAVLMGLSATAYSYTSRYEDKFIVDFSKSYITPVHNGAVTMRYNPSNFFF